MILILILITLIMIMIMMMIMMMMIIIVMTLILIVIVLLIIHILLMILINSDARQATAFLTGLKCVLPAAWLRMFDAVELNMPAESLKQTNRKTSTRNMCMFLKQTVFLGVSNRNDKTCPQSRTETTRAWHTGMAYGWQPSAMKRMERLNPTVWRRNGVSGAIETETRPDSA